MPFVPFGTQSRPGRRGSSGERLVNWFLEPDRSGSLGVSAGVLLGRSGLTEVATGAGVIRAMIRHAGLLYAVGGGKVWKLSGSTLTSVGSVVDDAYTTMASNGTQLAVVCGGRYYLYDGVTLAEYTLGALTNPTSVTHQDGRFLVSGTSGGRDDAFTYSSLSDGTTFNALEYAFGENAPDALVRIISNQGQIWLIGTETIEIWYNSGNVDFTFARNPGAIIEKGCKAGSTVVKEDNTLTWLASDGRVLRSGGAGAEKISTPEIEAELAGSTVEGAFLVSDRGHRFYAINRTGKTTLVWDFETGIWSEFSSGIDGPWLPRQATWVSGVQYLGCSSGQIVTQSETVYTDAGGTFRSEAISPPIVRRDQYMSVTSLSLRMDTGEVDWSGETTSAPQIWLEVSRDGFTWSQPRPRNLSQLGQYYERAVWHGLGAGKRMQFRLRISDPVPRDVYGVTYD